MVLAGELLLYAENFYRRFPEEFVSLGMPGLEEVFDLRTHGTKSRRISETPTEKTVEITIRRWQVPVMPSAMAYLPQSAYILPGTYDQQGRSMLSTSWPRSSWLQDPTMSMSFGALPMATAQTVLPTAQWPAQAQPMSANANVDDTYAAAQLSRLESAIMMLKPQVEAALANQAQQQAQPDHAQAQAQTFAKAQPEAEVQLHTSPLLLPQPLSQSQSQHPVASDSRFPRDLSPESPLRERRRLASLSIVKPEKGVAKGAVVHSVPVKELPKSSSEPALLSESRPQTGAGGATGSQTTTAQRTSSKEASRPSAVNCVRVAASILDPESPRSPGKYSAW